MDEARFGLLPVFRRVWSPKGVRPIKKVRLKYEWVYFFSVVQPYTGKTFNMIWDSVNLKVMQIFLDEFSKTLIDDEICLLVLDGAGWHNEKNLKVPTNIVLLKQPAYSPECNPTESLWDFVRDKLGIKLYENIKDLKNRLIDIVNSFDALKEELRCRLNFKWWNDAVI